VVGRYECQRAAGLVPNPFVVAVVQERDRPVTAAEKAVGAERVDGCFDCRDEVGGVPVRVV
jgi:hypothetical protein